MKVILIDDAETFGKKGEVKEVKNGLARNYLLPRKLAIEATPGNLKLWEHKRQALKKKEDQARAEAEVVAGKIHGLNLTIPVKVGEEEKLFGSVTSQNISDALAAQGFEVSRKDIELEAPIKTLGSYDVRIKFHPAVAVDIKVDVVREED